VLDQVSKVIQLPLRQFTNQFEMILNTELDCHLQMHTLSAIFPYKYNTKPICNVPISPSQENWNGKSVGAKGHHSSTLMVALHWQGMTFY